MNEAKLSNLIPDYKFDTQELSQIKEGESCYADSISRW